MFPDREKQLLVPFVIQEAYYPRQKDKFASNSIFAHAILIK